MKNTDLKTIEIVEICVRGRGGTLVESAIREAAAFSLTEDCRVVLTSNDKQYVFEPELLLKHALAGENAHA